MGIEEFITGRKKSAVIEYSPAKVADLEDDRVYIVETANKYYKLTLKGKSLKRIYPADKELKVYGLTKISEMRLNPENIKRRS